MEGQALRRSSVVITSLQRILLSLNKITLVVSLCLSYNALKWLSFQLRKLLGTCAWLIGAKLASLMRASFLSKVLEPAFFAPFGFLCEIDNHPTLLCVYHFNTSLRFRCSLEFRTTGSVASPDHCLLPLHINQNSPTPGLVSTLTQQPPCPSFNTVEIFAGSALNSLTYKSNPYRRLRQQPLCPPR